MKKVTRKEHWIWKYMEEGNEDLRQDGKICIAADMREKDLNTNMTGDRCRWKRLIKNKMERFA